MCDGGGGLINERGRGVCVSRNVGLNGSWRGSRLSFRVMGSWGFPRLV